jgi:hypothetical protein
VQVAEDHDDLHDRRNDADYEVAMPFSQADANEAVRKASDLLDSFEAELQLTPPAAVAAGIRAYLVTSGRIRP